MSDYLKRKQQPYIDTLFYNRYHLEMSEASELLKKFHDTYKRQNPWCKISYERSYNSDFLTMFFEHAAKDYKGMMERIEAGDCKMQPLAQWAAVVCNISLQDVPNNFRQ